MALAMFSDKEKSVCNVGGNHEAESIKLCFGVGDAV